MSNVKAPSSVRGQIGSAYRSMAQRADHRPCGGVGEMEAEMQHYATEWWAEEDCGTFDVGCCDHRMRPATIFAIEAARLLCAGEYGIARAEELLAMALDSVKKARQKGATMPLVTRRRPTKK